MRIEGFRQVVLIGMLTSSIAGCRWEPSERELRNAQAFEALLTAVSLKNAKAVEADAKRIQERRDSGELSEEPYKTLLQVIEKARSKDWAAAEKLAYDFRSKFGDDGAYFQ